jgi:hypothetical protein
VPGIQKKIYRKSVISSEIKIQMEYHKKELAAQKYFKITR